MLPYSRGHSDTTTWKGCSSDLIKKDRVNRLSRKYYRSEVKPLAHLHSGAG